MTDEMTDRMIVEMEHEAGVENKNEIDPIKEERWEFFEKISTIFSAAQVFDRSVEGDIFFVPWATAFYESDEVFHGANGQALSGGKGLLPPPVMVGVRQRFQISGASNKKLSFKDRAILSKMKTHFEFSFREVGISKNMVMMIGKGFGELESALPGTAENPLDLRFESLKFNPSNLPSTRTPGVPFKRHPINSIEFDQVEELDKILRSPKMRFRASQNEIISHWQTKRFQDCIDRNCGTLFLRKKARIGRKRYFFLYSTDHNLHFKLIFRSGLLPLVELSKMPNFKSLVDKFISKHDLLAEIE